MRVGNTNLLRYFNIKYRANKLTDLIDTRGGSAIKYTNKYHMEINASVGDAGLYLGNYLKDFKDVNN